jgi:hypothetical protein
MHCIVATSSLAEQVDEIAQSGLPDPREGGRQWHMRGNSDNLTKVKVSAPQGPGRQWMALLDDGTDEDHAWYMEVNCHAVFAGQHGHVKRVV